MMPSSDARKKRRAELFASLYDDVEAQPAATHRPAPAKNANEDDWEDEDDDEEEEDTEPGAEPKLPLPIDRTAIPERFPPQAVSGYPRIISERFHEDHDWMGNLTLADGVVTFLYRWEKATGKTGLLDKFFARGGEPGMSNGRGFGDFKVKEYGFKSKCKPEVEGMRYEVFVARTGEGILAGLRDEEREWMQQVSYRIKGDGTWEPLGTYGLLTPAGKSKNRKQIELDGAQIATTMLWFSTWSPESNIIEDFN